MYCHHFSPTDPGTVRGDWEHLDLRVLYNSSDLYATHHNSAVLMIQLINPSSALSSFNTRMTAFLHPGNSYILSLEQFTYKDNSEASDCVQQGKAELLELFDGYSYFGCIEECVAKAEFKACGCVALFSLFNVHSVQNDPDEKMRMCSIMDYFFCGKKLQENVGKKLFLKNSQKVCISYAMDTSYR